MTWLPLRLVIFDCDGVLIDSEPVSRRVLMEEAAALGFPLTEAGAHAFTGARASGSCGQWWPGGAVKS